MGLQLVSAHRFSDLQYTTTVPGTGQSRLWQDIIGNGGTFLCVTVTEGDATSVILFHMAFLIYLLEPLPEDNFDMDTFNDDNNDKVRRF